jgi:hypothetical protein
LFASDVALSFSAVYEMHPTGEDPIPVILVGGDDLSNDR